MPLRSRRAIALACLASVLLFAASVPASAQRLWYVAEGRTVHGSWRADVSVLPSAWRPGQPVDIQVHVRLDDTHLASLADAGIKANRLCVLVTAERTFDPDGWMRLASDERMSTLLTPTGLAIEGGVQGAVTTRYGYAFASPLDELQAIPVSEITPGRQPGTVIASFVLAATLPAALPPGLYRLRTDIGVMVGARAYNINGYAFASRPFSDQAGTSTYFYSPLIPASGLHASGRPVDAARIQPRFPWLLLASYNSNGYRGVVADEDRHRFATSDRSLIPDDVILPMYSDSGSRLSYSLEPQFPTDTIDPLQNIAWDWKSGELAVRVTGPDGSVVDLGRAPFQGKAGNGPTTGNPAFTAWRPQAYGRYAVTATGWIADREGRRYEGGGTYRFWIAKRMTLATATFQGMPYTVGASYGRDIQFNPALPADVEVTATLYVGSDPNNVRTLSYSGKATTAGLFGAAQGMRPFPLSAPGEYHAQVLATYTDGEGHLWVSTMRHAGIVYPESSPIVARGKKLLVSGRYVDRGETKDEGYIADGVQHLAHITFPYNAGDVLLIAAEGQGANKIEPVLIAQAQGDTAAWDTRLNGVGVTNLRLTTSNGYSPHLYPEYIRNREYYYAAAPRPGFMGRFLVGESHVFAPYWSVSPNSFGGQIGASPNGDAPGDIYRLIGGVVMRRADEAPMYAGYIASAFLLPKGSKNNRVVAPGSEDLHGPTGHKGRFFLVGLRPGTAFEVGATFRPAVQIDPLLPVSIRFTLLYPDGRRQVAEGVADRFGSFAGASAWPLDVPGVYRYQLRGTWNGFEGQMPGLPADGGELYVYSKTRRAGTAGLQLDGPTHRTFSPTAGLTISGSSTASHIRYALLTPGAVVEQGEIPVVGGRFQYVFNPAAVNAKVPLYDIVSITTGRPQIGRVIHLTFFSQERAAGGTFFDFARVILRGTTALSARALIPTVAASGAPAPAGAMTVAAPPAGALALLATEVDAIRTWDTPVDRLLRDNHLRVASRKPDPTVPNRVHERLQQFHGDLPVFGGDVMRQLADGVTVSLFGTIYLDVTVETSPALTYEDARAAVERMTGGVAAASHTPVLGVLPLDGSRYVLAWRVEWERDGRLSDCFVDASSGTLIGSCPAAASRRGAIGGLPGVLHRAETAALQQTVAYLTSAATDDAAVHAPEANTVATRAFLLAIDGDRGAPASTAHREQVRSLFLRAFTYLLPSTATAATARAVTLQAARDVYGAGSEAERAIARAWKAVGVGF